MVYSTNNLYKVETKEKALELIHNYYNNANTLISYVKEYEDTIGGANISKYGIEASLPKSNEVNITPFIYEIDRRMKRDKMVMKLNSKLIPVQQVKKIIKDETEELVLELRMDGKSLKKIYQLTGVDKRKQYKIFDKIAHEIVKCSNATKCTN